MQLHTQERVPYVFTLQITARPVSRAHVIRSGLYTTKCYDKSFNYDNKQTTDQLNKERWQHLSQWYAVRQCVQEVIHVDVQ